MRLIDLEERNRSQWRDLQVSYHQQTRTLARQ